jgi:starch-binding outer membrane protein, SusD/RagB family
MTPFQFIKKKFTRFKPVCCITPGKKFLFPFIAILLPVFFSCTKLSTNVHDQIINFWQTDDQIAAGVAPAYAGLRSYAPFNGAFDPGVYPLLELSTDEIIMPNRGGDWYDGGVWEEMWKHNWTSFSPLMENGWQFIYSGITRINQITKSVEIIQPRPKNYTSIVAELKTVRAFYNFLALDLYGNVPIVDSNNVELSKLTPKKRTEVFTYIEKEIKDNLQSLSNDVNSYTYGRVTTWMAQALLAKLYLNAEAYTGTPLWSDCIAACDAILNSNKYSLEPDFFSNFKIDNESSKENIFVIPFDIQAGLNPFWLQAATLHYHSDLTFGLDAKGVNGLCSTAEYYNLFAPDDKRREMFLVGQQYIGQIADLAHMQYTDNGDPLSFDPAITSFALQGSQIQTAGARCHKWEFNKTGGGIMSNDFAIFRLADIILMKAEAQYEKGDIQGALTTINQKINDVSIHSRAGLPDFTEAEMNRDGLLKERACELSWEGWRRNDMIRLGHFTDERIPEKQASEEFRKLYPIPKPELDKNSYLVQNPGY